MSQRAYEREYERVPEPEYCDYCEREGHTFLTCPARDDDYHNYLDEYEYDEDEYDVPESTDYEHPMVPGFYA